MSRVKQAQELNDLGHTISANIDSIAQLAAGECYDRLSGPEMDIIYRQLKRFIKETEKTLIYLCGLADE